MLFANNCSLLGSFNRESVLETASMMYRMAKMDASVRKRVPGLVCVDIVDVNEAKIDFVAYARQKDVFEKKEKLDALGIVVGCALKVDPKEITCFPDMAHLVAPRKDKETLMLEEMERDRADVAMGAPRRCCCFLFDVYYRVVFSKPVCRAMMANRGPIEDDMVAKGYCEQLKVAAFDNCEDVGYVRLTLRAANAYDAANAAYERDSLLAFCLNCFLSNKVDDIAVASAALLEGDGLLHSATYSLLADNEPLVLPPYSLPCGPCQERDCRTFGLHMRYSDFGRPDWQEWVLSVFGAPTYYYPRPAVVEEKREKKEKTVGEAFSGALKDMLLTPKRRRPSYRRRRRHDGACLLGLVGGLAVLGAAAGVMWVKEKIEEKKEDS